MSHQSPRAATIDGPAIALSGLCLIHCLFLPVLSAILPVAGTLGEAEWLHKAFIVAALPFTLMALRSKQIRPATALLIVLGFGLLATGAFVEALHDLETQLTVAGALTLALGHALRWSAGSRQA